MRLRAVAAVGLEGTLGHRTVLIRESLPCGQVLSIADSVQIRQSFHFGLRHSSAAEKVLRFATIRSARTTARPRSNARSPSSSRICIFAPATSSHASRLCRQVVVNSPQNMSVFGVTSHVFTSSGATQLFGDNAAHSMPPSVLVSAPFTTEFSGVTPNPGSNKRLRTDSPSRRDSR
jgi:hypothetical protein